MQNEGENDAFCRDLTARMASGEEEAYRLFYEACFDKLLRHLLIRTRGDEALARDLSQTVLLRVVRYIKPLPGERALWAWLHQTCRSAHVDWLRANGKTIDPGAIEFWQEQQSTFNDADEELLQHLENSLATLDANERELLQCAYFEAMPQRAIADRLGSTSKAVESKLARIRRKLRRNI